MQRPNNMHKPLYVAVAGNIGSGKSSLTTLLSQNLGWKAYYEVVETNPYLSDFYSDMLQWSFHTQMFFLTKRFQHLQEILRSEDPVVQDRSIYEDCEIFARNLYLSGRMTERDYKTYMEHFHVMEGFIRPPDLMVYLRSHPDVLHQRISKRGRAYEQQIDTAYLGNLCDRYDAWAGSYRRGPIATLDVSDRDFVNKQEDLNHVLSLVKWEIDRLSNRSQVELPLGMLRPSPKSRPPVWN